MVKLIITWVYGSGIVAWWLWCEQNLKCHSKSAHDFAFIASSSLIATAGHSTESRNVCLWDTLQPQRTALIQGRLIVSIIHMRSLQDANKINY